MRFSVWTGLKAHQPLGNINRARNEPYGTPPIKTRSMMSDPRARERLSKPSASQVHIRLRGDSL